jgi:hypothetical protein
MNYFYITYVMVGIHILFFCSMVCAMYSVENYTFCSLHLYQKQSSYAANEGTSLLHCELGNECCICFEDKVLKQIPCPSKPVHPDRICEQCLKLIQDTQPFCPLCRHKLEHSLWQLVKLTAARYLFCCYR